jgi:hypothetical protein
MTDTTATTEPTIEEPIVEEIIDSEVETDDASIIEKTAHVLAVPVKKVTRVAVDVYAAFSHRLERTRDIRRGRKFVMDAQRRAFADLGEKQRNAENT